MPTASILNYAAVPGLNIANGPTVAICDPAVATCTSDFTIQADGAATQVVADVQGYFRNLRTDQLPVPDQPEPGGDPALVRGEPDGGLPGVGSLPFGVAFDGANIWVTNCRSNNVTKLRASDGASLGTFPVGVQPQRRGLRRRQHLGGELVQQQRARSCGRATAPTSAPSPQAAFPVAWPSTAPTSGCDLATATLTKLRASDGANLGTLPRGAPLPAAWRFDGANVWVANYGSGNVTKLRASDGARPGHLPRDGPASNGVAFDGANIWVADRTAATT